MTSTTLVASPVFVYSPLQNASKEIRLLRILPVADDNDDDDHVVSVRLVGVENVTTTPYDALSYTWGDESKTKPILVNECRFEVTENLYAVLRQLRAYSPGKDHMKSEFIWIDAVCIDQKNHAEKSLQVQMMKDIFSGAVQVFVSLGTDIELIRQGVTAATALITPYVNFLHSTDQDPSNTKLHYDSMLSELKDFVKEGSGQMGWLIFIKTLVRLPWWDRVWIIQEVAVNENVYVLLGNEALDFNYFRHLYLFIVELNKIPASDVDASWSIAISHIYSAIHRNFKVLRSWGSETTSLLQALEMIFVVGLSQATNPRDRLYALAGLNIDIEAAVGKVDYLMPWQSLYTKVARNLLKEEGLRVLSFCTPLIDRQKNGLPSWVPDWREYIPCSVSLTASSKLFEACGNTSQIVHDADQGQELTLVGTLVARIDETRSPFSLQPGTERTPSWAADFKAMRIWHNDIKSLVQLLTVSEEQNDQIVLRTTSADACRKTKFYRLTPDDYVGYDAFVKILNTSRSADQDISFASMCILDAAAAPYYQRVLAVAEGRRPFRSDKDHVGIAPEVADIGDMICVILGATVPFVLRPESEGRYRLLGEAYVDGIMDGQHMDSQHTVEKFVLC